VLFVLMGLVTAYLGLWLPLWRDRAYPPETDTRIGFIIAGFAPLTTGTAVLAAYGYIRLWLLQRRSPTTLGWSLLILLALPVMASATTGVYLAPTAAVMLPSFVKSVFWSIAELFGL